MRNKTTHPTLRVKKSRLYKCNKCQSKTSFAQAKANGGKCFACKEPLKGLSK